MGEDLKKEECFECHGYGYGAFKCAIRLSRVRQETQSSQATKATQNSTLSYEEKCEDSKNSPVSKVNDNYDDVASCNSSLAPKDETESDLEAEYDLALDDLIKANITISCY